MIQHLVIDGRLPGLNEYTAKCRTNHYVGAQMKKQAQAYVSRYIMAQRLKPMSKPVVISYTWYEANKRRDHDNVSGFGHKVINDALVKAGVLADDGWAEVVGYADAFAVDKDNPRIEVILTEVE